MVCLLLSLKPKDHSDVDRGGESLVVDEERRDTMVDVDAYFSLFCAVGCAFRLCSVFPLPVLHKVPALKMLPFLLYQERSGRGFVSHWVENALDALVLLPKNISS